MANFRKKPVMIQAVQWTGNRVENPPDWLLDAIRRAGTPEDAGCAMRMGNQIHIGTLEGVMIASPGDWIIRGVAGELYPCKPHIFEQTYEACDEFGAALQEAGR